MVEVPKGAQKVRKKDIFSAYKKPSCFALDDFFRGFIKPPKTTFPE